MQKEVAGVTMIEFAIGNSHSTRAKQKNVVRLHYRVLSQAQNWKRLGVQKFVIAGP